MPLFDTSTLTRERTFMLPLPVLSASRMPFLPYIIPPVGKSGPLTNFINSSISTSGSSIIAIIALEISLKLNGGIFVAIPTAIPLAPFICSCGNRVGSTVGSSSVSSKFGVKSTVSLSMSRNISSAIFCILASVYLIAAAPSPSTDPKFPCPCTNGYLSEKSCAILTRESYIAVSPCG